MAASATGLAALTARGARLWHFVDARNQVLGRLAPQIARLLMGKHKPTYVPSVDCGDFVVVVNAREVALTGTKRTTKLYRWHTGWMGGLKTLTARQMFERDARRVVALAVKGMLPDNKLRDPRLKRLRVFPDAAQPHATQLAQSRAYAGAHLAAVAPLDVAPRAAGESGALVVDAKSRLDAAGLAALEAQFVEVTHSADFAKAYDAFRAEKTARAQAARDARDGAVLESVAAAAAAEAAAAAAAAAAPPPPPRAAAGKAAGKAPREMK
jgi:large subunit ribosomal protein L13